MWQEFKVEQEHEVRVMRLSLPIMCNNTTQITLEVKIKKKRSVRMVKPFKCELLPFSPRKRINFFLAILITSNFPYD